MLCDGQRGQGDAPPAGGGGHLRRCGRGDGNADEPRDLDDNHEIESAGSDAFVTDGVGDKLREWIRRLVALIKKVATEWGAIHYSIGVSLEGLSLSVEWAGPKGN